MAQTYERPCGDERESLPFMCMLKTEMEKTEKVETLATPEKRLGGGSL